ncbi:hypothetical protein [Arthrobacter sedimenti]|nr:hypothetical protein [Arthrobacter sedimenti]
MSITTHNAVSISFRGTVRRPVAMRTRNAAVTPSASPWMSISHLFSFGHG